MATRHTITILAVRDLARAVTFYDAALGWPHVVDAPVYVELDAGGGSGGARVGLYERNGWGRNTGRVPTAIADGELAPTELYLRADDLDAAIARLRAAGARELSPRAARPWGEEAAYFADPDGNVVVVARPIE